MLHGPLLVATGSDSSLARTTVARNDKVMNILSPELRQAILESGDQPVNLLDPQTQEHYVLLRREAYERLQLLLEHNSPPRRSSDACLAWQANGPIGTIPRWMLTMNTLTLVGVNIEGEWNVPLLDSAAEVSGASLMLARDDDPANGAGGRLWPTRHCRKSMNC